MRRLIEKGLMFGDLVPVESPVLIERYKRALKHLTGLETTLPDFHVDISGFSPEIGDEMSDDHYLNHDGADRQFILLGTEQARAPLLNVEFSTSRGILRQFIAANEAQLFALTARDAVAGGLAGSVYGAETPALLLGSHRVTVEADTTTGTVATAGKLTGLINRFKSEPDAWWDDVLIAEMIGLARVTGDLSRNPVALQAMTFEQESFWTSRFGGLYVFRGVPKPAVVSVGDKGALGSLPLDVIGSEERTALARWLTANDMVEPIVAERGPQAAAILRQKMDFIVADLAGGRGASLEGATRRELRGLGRRYAGELPAEWEGLAALAAWAEEGADWPRITSEHPAYFYTLRARRRPDADLVNMMLAELTPLDGRQLFICHKEAFYRLYQTWPEPKKAYVVEVLANEYMVDKAGTRAALFGPEAGMEEPTAPSGPGPWGRSSGASARVPRLPDRDPWDAPLSAPAPPEPPPLPQAIIDAVGPWGTVRGRRP